MPRGDQSPRLAGALAAALAIAAAAGCAREERNFRELAADSAPTIVQSDLRPGFAAPPPPRPGPYAGNAHAIAEGKRLYMGMNCVGCHFNGGGGIGPPLMDDAWIYGREAANIFATIMEGRPNGMPSFRDHLTDKQVWQLVEYVHSLSGLNDASPPGRRQGGDQPR